MENQVRQTWRKSTYSGNGGSDCVEVANAARMVLVRDTKRRDGATLTIPADAWRAFASEIKARLGVQHDRGTPQRFPKTAARVPFCCPCSWGTYAPASDASGRP